ncbi:MAG: aldo/keto reductase [Candidatus Latescibacterota bacterium]|nr:aldo/keto reductase [Candidatus Latescibacterota bacterium]
MLPTRRLGRTEMTPACLGLGGAWWGGADSGKDTTAGVGRALELGMNFLDTYPGQGESFWGEVLSRNHREQVYLQAKVSSHVGNEMRSDHSAGATRRSIENSLRCFGTDYLDSVLIHGYDEPIDFGREPCDYLDPLAPGNALDELIKLRDRGTVRHIGIGARDAMVHQRAIATGEIELVLTYLEYNLLTQAAEAELFPHCREHDVGVILASPLGMGLLTGRSVDDDDERRMIRDTKTPRATRMLDWSRERGVDIRHLAIQFCLATPVESIVLPGQASADEVDGTYEAATTAIAAEIWRDFGQDFDIDVSHCLSPGADGP